MNLRTGHVSPQFHVVFDEDFTTVEALALDSEPDNWDFLCKTQAELNDAHDVENADAWHYTSPSDLLLDVDINEMSSTLPPHNESSSPDHNTAVHGGDTPSSPPPTQSVASGGDEAPDTSHIVDLNAAGRRHSSRIRANRTRIVAALMSLLFCPPLIFGLIAAVPVSFVARHFMHDEYVNLNADNTINSLNPLSFAALGADNEVYHFGDMLKQPDVPEFLKAMIAEVKDHTNRGHWVIRPRSKIGDKKTLRTVWSFKRKRAPDGTLLKYKARLCINGATQV